MIKHFQENRKKINTVNYNLGIKDPRMVLQLYQMYQVKTQARKSALVCSEVKQFRMDYRELLELSIIYLEGTHHARWDVQGSWILH